jgi:hypothetical protein
MQNKKCCKNNTDLVCNNTDLECNNKVISEEPSDENKFYKFYPLILTFVFVIGGAAISQYNFENFKWNEFMKNLMGLMLITFSYLKLLNPSGFKKSFSNYDYLAKYISIYGYIYPLIELILGILYIIEIFPILINSLVIFIFTINLIQVGIVIYQGKKLECACMGSLGLKLPLSWVTILEDVFMIIMAIIMLSLN